MPSRQSAKIYRAIRKYGAGNLIVQTLCIGTPEYCLDLENNLRPSPEIGWNIGPGGTKTTLGRRATEAQRLHFSKVHSGRKWTEKQRVFMSALYKGKKLRLGSKMPQAAKDKIGAAHRGRKYSEDTKRRMSEAGKKRMASPEARAMASAAQLGRLRPEAAKWRHHHANARLWMQASEIYDTYQNRAKKQFTSEQLVQFGLSPQQLYELTKFFKQGWNPHTDPEYQEWKVSMARDCI